MRLALALLFVLHGIAHWVGFVVPWRLAEFEELPYKTTLLSGRIDVGDIGIRIMGILFLLACLAFVGVGISVWMKQAGWPVRAGAIAAFSLAVCVLGWPDSRIGVFVNLAILALLFLGSRYGWWSGV